jgi:hypothetical protein
MSVRRLEVASGCRHISIGNSMRCHLAPMLCPVTKVQTGIWQIRCCLLHGLVVDATMVGYGSTDSRIPLHARIMVRPEELGHIRIGLFCVMLLAALKNCAMCCR